MASSIALAAYFAERNQGAFHNLFMTFSSRPQIVELQGRDIFDKISFIRKADWGFDTNFEAAMEQVLEIAVRNHCTQAELPKALVCITDMEFNAASCSGHSTYYENVRKMFRNAGYEAPVLVFWNVNARNDVFHAAGTNEGVILVAGQSAVTFQNLIRFLNGNAPITPVEQMYEVLNSERYQQVRLPE